MKEIKDNINRWRDSSCSYVGRSSIVKLTILPNAETYTYGRKWRRTKEPLDESERGE